MKETTKGSFWHTLSSIKGKLRNKAMCHERPLLVNHCSCMQIQANIFGIYPVTALPTPHCLCAQGQWEQGSGGVATHTHCNALIRSEVSLSVSAQSALAAACVISLSFQRNSAQTVPASDPLPGPTASPP